jgi:hypothetical protein
MAEDEYESAPQAVVAAAAECRRQSGGADNTLGDVLTIWRGVVRACFPDRQDGDDISELACLAALETNGLPWRLA